MIEAEATTLMHFSCMWRRYLRELHYKRRRVEGDKIAALHLSGEKQYHYTNKYDKVCIYNT